MNEAENQGLGEGGELVPFSSQEGLASELKDRLWLLGTIADARGGVDLVIGLGLTQQQVANWRGMTGNNKIRRMCVAYDNDRAKVRFDKRPDAKKGEVERVFFIMYDQAEATSFRAFWSLMMQANGVIKERFLYYKDSIEVYMISSLEGGVDRVVRFTLKHKEGIAPENVERLYYGRAKLRLPGPF